MATAPARRRVPAMKNFVEQITECMAKRGFTIANLAEESGISRAYLYRVLDGTQTPSMEVADKIAEALGLVITTIPAR